MERQVDDFVGAFAVLCRGDRFLLVANERLIDGKLQRVWDLPGGRVEDGEMVQEALRRELALIVQKTRLATDDARVVRLGSYLVDMEIESQIRTRTRELVRTSTLPIRRANTVSVCAAH